MNKDTSPAIAQNSRRQVENRESNEPWNNYAHIVLEPFLDVSSH